MNANELADMIDSDNWVGMDDQEHMEWEMKAATMLRQLQAELQEEKEHSAILEKDRDVFLAENEVWKKYFEAFHKAFESNNKQRQIIFNRNAEIKKLQAENEALVNVIKECFYFINGCGVENQRTIHMFIEKALGELPELAWSVKGEYK